MNGRATRGEAPGKERAAIDGIFEPGIEFGRDVAIEKDLDGLFLFASELAHLEGSDVGGGFPIDVAGAFQGFVGADAVEIAAQPAVMGFDFAGDSGQKIVEAGLGIDGRVDHHFAAQRDQSGAFEEAEGEGGGKGEAVLTVGAAVREEHLDGFFDRGAAGDQGKVNAGAEGGALGMADAFDANGKRRHQPLGIAHEEFSGDAAARGDVLGNEKIELEAGHAEAADETGDEERGEHRGHDEEEEIVG